ncbi:Histone-binding protein MSI1 [Acorus gramineus]|uniref:Histone-binding protein MSI1 n=1 Tax=Acorus gramineus TaxID=55184 RepID=A0AAV9ARS4_ACOGR|nr:Histone-binding protein MSI1 [Acorus gramineus]
MISSLCWVPKGASKPVPVVAEPPSKEELEEMLISGFLDISNDSDGDGDEEMEDRPSNDMDEINHALAAADALGQTSASMNLGNSLRAVTDDLKELDMDHYDDEDDGVEIFSGKRGGTYYPSNELDPYLKDKDDDDEEEAEDMSIKPTDAVIACVCNEDDVNYLKVSIYEEFDDGESNMYVHHDIILPAFPLCTAWLDFKPKTGDQGNFIAIGSMDPAIEIWDLDIMDEVQPFLVLGGVSEKKKKGKKKSVKYKENSHRDAVLGLAWNKILRNLLASASADESVKIWDLAKEACALTLPHHTDKVQAVTWNQDKPEVLLSGSFDRSVVMMDMRSSSRTGWSVSADVESLAWDPHNSNCFVVSLEDGTVQGFDIRAASSNADSGSKPSFTLHAHDKAVCAVSYNPSVANLLATGSTDKMVKLWDLSNNQPSCVASLKAGAVFSLSFSEDNPSLLASGGSKGKLQVWDILSDPGVERKYKGLRNQNMNPPPQPPPPTATD